MLLREQEMNAAEERFKRIAKGKKWLVVRPGWPDFICLDQNRNLFGVEVKHSRDWVSQSQHDAFDILDRYGFPILVWHTGFPKKFWEWKDTRGEWCGRNYSSRSIAKYLRPKE